MSSNDEEENMTGSSPKERTKETPPLLFSYRSAVSILGFLGFVNLYSQRINLSVAMVCMVNHTALTFAQADENVTKSVRVSDCGAAANGSLTAEDGEFEWPKYIQGLSLGSFFWGYITTQVIGGWLSLRFGGKRVFGFSMFTCSVVTCLMPMAARVHFTFLMVLRIIAGVCQGVVWPAGHTVFARWTPPLEKSRLLGFAFAGAQIGNVITLPIGGLLCRYGFAGGWPSIFYCNGMFGLVWFALWMIIISDSPSKNRWIKEEEKQYIQDSLKHCVTKKRTGKVPWSSLLRSVPVWAILVSHTCSNWGNYMFLTQFPTYLKEVAGFDVKTNGFTSAIPYIGYYLMVLTSASIADQLKKKGLFSTTNSRKLFNSLGQLTPALFSFLVTFLTCEYRLISVALLVIAMSFMGNNHGSGYLVNPADIAPQYSGIIFGISNTAATIPGMIGPSIVGAMTTERTREQWNNVFYVTSVIYTFGAVFYIIFGSGDLQEWARTPIDEDKKDKKDAAPLNNTEL